MRRKTYAKNQPTVALDPRGKSLVDRLNQGQGGLPSSFEGGGEDRNHLPLENAQTDYVRLPRPMHHRRGALKISSKIESRAIPNLEINRIMSIIKSWAKSDSTASERL